jgi:quercetin dioxygenase-like cupin family protein
MSWTLRLSEDRLDGVVRRSLASAPRVVFVLAGAPTVDGVALDRAWHGTGACTLAAPAPAAVLRYEVLAAAAPAPAPAARADSRVVLEHALELDPACSWLMRCDRVEFAPGGVALPHGHKGGGIRRLLEGTLEVTVGTHAPRLMRPGDAWFESGREPVLARASRDEVTAFVRVSVLPREIRGQSSIVYVDPADAARGRPRRYTVYVDEPIDLPRG